MDVRHERIAILQRTAFVSEKKHSIRPLTPFELVRFSRGLLSNMVRQRGGEILPLVRDSNETALREALQRQSDEGLAIASALPGADLLILDEPNNRFGPDNGRSVDACPGRGCSRPRLHDLLFFPQLEEVERIAEYAGFIDHGKLLMEARIRRHQEQIPPDHCCRQLPSGTKPRRRFYPLILRKTSTDTL